MSVKKHATVPIFVPHQGCPRQCSFCDQHAVSGEQTPPSPEDVDTIIKKAAALLQPCQRPAQIAFFGGSFTAIKHDYMLSLLRAAQKYADGITFSGIRISTRPDAVTDEILAVLAAHSVTDIELGAQSMEDAILKANVRGHTSADTATAAKRIKDRGFGLGLQMMTGLHKSAPEQDLLTANRLIALNPDCVRIYPTVVLKNTTLAKLYQSGEYTPQSQEEAIALGAELLALFSKANIPVIRFGLHDNPELAQNIIAGPHHPALRELCESRVLINKVIEGINKKQLKTNNIRLAVAPNAASKMAGHKRQNLIKLQNMGYNAKIVTREGIGYLEVQVAGMA